MDRNDQLEIFKAQTENVRMLEKAWHHLNRTINRELIEDDLISASLHSKLLALVFCAWSEANFSKLIHTPHGFELYDIQQIKNIASSDIVKGWLKCLELGLYRISSTPKSSYIPNIKQSVERIIYSYVQEPQLIRNKIAHGQWHIALNSKNDAINKDISTQVDKIDAVKVLIWKKAYSCLSNIIEMLIESPNKAFHRDYWQETVKVEVHLQETERWNLEMKIKLLKKKSQNYKRHITTAYL